MASRQFSAGATVKHLKIIQIDQEFLKSEEVERRRKVPRLDRWKGGPAETPYKRVRLLAAAIGRVQPRQKRDAICRRLWLRMKTNNTLPDRFAGKDASPNNPKPWDPDTFEGYLRGLKTNPKEHEEQLILAELKALLTSRFEEVGRVGDSIDIIFSSTYPLPSDYLLALLGSAAEEPDHVFAPGPEYVSVRGKGFEVRACRRVAPPTGNDRHGDSGGDQASRWSGSCSGQWSAHVREEDLPQVSLPSDRRRSAFG